MNRIFRILPIALALFLVSANATAQKDWIGTYAFGENGGKTAGGTTIFIEHELSIFAGDGGLAASLQSNGYQTSADLVCSIKVDGSKLQIFFESYGENNMFEPYNKGDLLLTLERRTEKGKTAVITHWGKFTPAIPKNEKSGKVYFERSAPKP